MKKIPPTHRSKFLLACFILLTVVYGLLLLGAIYSVFVYDKSVGGSSPVQTWVDQNATSYNTDVYDALLAMKEVSIAYRDVIAYKSSQKARSRLNEQLELFEGNLVSFKENTIAGHRLQAYESAREALPAAAEFHALLVRWVNDAQAVSPTQIIEAEEKARTTLRKLTSDAGRKEFQARDDMADAIKASRELADTALKIGTFLFALSFLALAGAWFISGKWIHAERSRFHRLEYLLATVGHDMRSLLQVIVGGAGLLRKPPMSDVNEKYVRIVMESSKQLENFVDDLVCLAGGDDLSFDPKPLPLDTWLKKITDRFSINADQEGLSFVVSALSYRLPTIMFDELRLDQCVGNLLTNAFLYTKKGSITLTVKIQKSMTQADRLIISVADTGPGIASKDRERIFEPFVRATAGTKGKGLGLAIVGSIVRSAKGDISLNSSVGFGSIFSIELPLVYAEKEERPLDHSVASLPTDTGVKDPLHSGRVLIVEDDALIRKIIAEIVTNMGYLTDQAPSGEEAFSLALDRQYHAIITDIQMAGWDGFKLAEECRKQLLKCPHIIAMTAFTNKLSLDSRATIFDKILAKPIDDEELLAALENMPSSR